MKNNQKNIQFGEPGFKFTRVKHGYSFEEVDNVIDMLTQQNNYLINENNRLNQLLNECNVKIEQLAQSTQLMEEERQNEKLRLADVMTIAGRAAEETVAEARRMSVELIAEANVAAGRIKREARAATQAIYKELASLSEIIRSTRKNSDQHYDNLDKVLQGAIELIDIKKETAPVFTSIDTINNR